MIRPVIHRGGLEPTGPGRTHQWDAEYYAGLIQDGTGNIWLIYEFLKVKYRSGWQHLSRQEAWRRLRREFRDGRTPELTLRRGYDEFLGWLEVTRHS